MKRALLMFLFFATSFTLSYGQSGRWEFDNPDNLTEATLGTDLELIGSADAVTGSNSGDGAISIGAGSYLKALTPAQPSGNDSNVNSYSLLIDFKVNSYGSWISLLQTDVSNSNDGDLFISPEKKIGVGSLGYSNVLFEDGEWYRMIMVCEEIANSVSVDIYLNGELKFQGADQAIDSRFSLGNQFLLFADNNDEDNTINVSKVDFFDYALTSSDVANWGTVSKIVGQWDFDDAGDLAKATVGDDLELFGNVVSVNGITPDDGAVFLGNNDYLKATTNIMRKGPGETRVNTYTYRLDIKMDNLGWNCLLQPKVDNSSDGQLFVGSYGQVGKSSIGYSAHDVIKAGEWARIIMVVEENDASTVSVDVYVNGVLAVGNSSQTVDGKFALDEDVLFFLDDGSEEMPTAVSQVVLYNYALSSAEILELGSANEGKKIVGQWDFNNANNLAKATVGDPIEIFGNVPFIDGPGNENGAILLEKGNYLKATTNIIPSGAGTKVNTYTYRLDIKMDNLGWNCLLQPKVDNSSDGQLFVGSNGEVGKSSIGYSAHDVIKAGEWARIIMVVEENDASTVSVDVYVNGVLAVGNSSQTVDGKFALDEDVLFFLDDGSEEMPTAVSQVVLYNYALSSAEISALGDASIEYGSSSSDWQYPSNTTFTTIAAPAGATSPGYLSTYDDNTTSTRMLKISTEGSPTHNYAKQQPWNIDGTKYKIRDHDIYNADHTLYKSLGGLGTYKSLWSNTDPNILYCFRQLGEIKRYNIETDNMEVLYDLNSNSEYDIVRIGPGEGNIDIHDKYVALISRVNNTTDVRIIIFDLQTSQIVTTKTFTNMWRDGYDWRYQYIDWVSVSQSGDYLGIMWNHNYAKDTDPFYDASGNPHYGVELYNTTNLSYIRRLVRYGNHGDFGFTPDGKEVFVQFFGETSWHGAVFSYHLDGSGVDVIITDEVFPTEEQHHISCRNILRPGWAYLNTAASGDGDGRMLAAKLDGSGTIENFGHSFALNLEAFPVPNPTGTKIMFKSNFGDDSSGDKICDYEAYPILPGMNKSLAPNKNNLDNMPTEYVLEQNYPNPFNPTTVIRFSLPKQSHVKLSVYNIIGEKVAELVNGNISAGNQEVSFNASNLASGMYIYRITATSASGSFVAVKKMLLLK